MLTYILGPFLSLMPARWRKTLSFTRINWIRASAISGFIEFSICLVASLKWYAVTMTLWVNRGLDVAMNGKAGEGITDHAIGAAALLIWASEPLTWLLGYFTLEGAIRFCGGAFSDTALGSLPLFLVDKVLGIFVPGSKTDEEAPGAASSFFGAIGEKLLESAQPASADEIVATQKGIQEFLEIRASRRKPDWDPPRVVRIRDSYYRLESCSKGTPPRPFRYTLRKLVAGVPGRNVLLYEAEGTLVDNR